MCRNIISEKFTPLKVVYYLFLGHFWKVDRQYSLCMVSSVKGSCVCNFIQATSNCYFCWLRCYFPWWYSSCWKVWLIQFLHLIICLKWNICMQIYKDPTM